MTHATRQLSSDGSTLGSTLGRTSGDTLEYTQSARLDAELLACHVSGLSRTGLFAHPETTLDAGALQQLDDLLKQRSEGVPMAYLLGNREFWSMQLHVQPGVLVPRPDTELLVEITVQLAHSAPDGPIADLGTGTAAIALAIARELPERTLIAIERSAVALPVAAQNISEHSSGNVSLIQGDWLDSMADNSLAIVAANPPYLAKDDPHLPGLVHEPQAALVSGTDGLDDIELIIRQCARVGKSGALLLLEHGSEQGSSVRALFRQYGYAGVSTRKDLAGLERVSYACLPSA